jgi:drug/metabolite transporter (DMT)-like permease
LNPYGYKVWGGFVFIAAIWGSTWLAIRIGLESMDPFFSSGIRFLIAAAILYLIIKYRRIQVPLDKRSLYLYLYIGLFSFAVPYGLVYWGEQRIPSGLASIIFASFPFFVALFSKIFLPDEEIGFYKIVGIIIGFIGIIIIFSEGISLDMNSDFAGMAAIGASALIQASAGVAVKKYGKHIDPFSTIALPTLIGGILLLIVSFLSEDFSAQQFDVKGILSALYLGAFGTVATFTTFYWLLKKMNIAILSLNTFLTPIIAVILGWLIMGEVLSINTILGSACVLIGILFANFKGLINFVLNKNEAKA